MSTLKNNVLEGVSSIPNFIPSGTRMLFCQANAPSGWTKIVGDLDNRALRVVTGSGGGIGGSLSFTSVFTSRFVPVQSHTHGINDPGHKHGLINVRGFDGASNSPGGSGNPIAGYGVDMTTNTTGISIQPSGDVNATMDFSVRYVDVIICEKI